MSIQESVSASKFSAMDPNLQRLAAKAALEIDLHVNGTRRDGRLSAVEGILLQIATLSASNKAYQHLDPKSYLADPISGDVLAQSLPLLLDQKINNLQELAEVSRKFSNVMGSHAPKDLEKDLLLSLKRFIIEVAKNSSIKRDSIMGSIHDLSPYKTY